MFTHTVSINPVPLPPRNMWHLHLVAPEMDFKALSFIFLELNTIMRQENGNTIDSWHCNVADSSPVHTGFLFLQTRSAEASF